MPGENTLLETELTFAPLPGGHPKKETHRTTIHFQVLLGCPRNLVKRLGSVAYNPNIYPIYTYTYISRVK